MTLDDFINRLLNAQKNARVHDIDTSKLPLDFLINLKTQVWPTAIATDIDIDTGKIRTTVFLSKTEADEQKTTAILNSLERIN